MTYPRSPATRTRTRPTPTSDELLDTLHGLYIVGCLGYMRHNDGTWQRREYELASQRARSLLQASNRYGKRMAEEAA